MSLNGIIRRASSFLGLTASESSKPTYEDGDIVFCKNNVCVHPPWRCRADGEREKVHHPGYLVIKCQEDPATHATTLHLSWIPNDRLRRNHELISQSAEGNSRSNSPYPTSDSESLSMSSLALHDSNGTVRKMSLDDAALSTSGISTLDTASDGTHSKEEVSPNSEGGSGHSPHKAAQGEEASRSSVTGSSGCPEEDEDEDEVDTAEGTPDTPKYTSIEDSGEQNQESQPAEDRKEDTERNDEQEEEEQEEVGKGEVTQTEDSAAENISEETSTDPKENTEMNETTATETKETNTDETEPQTTQETTEDSDKDNRETTNPASTEESETPSLETTQMQTKPKASIPGGGERMKARHISSSSSSTDEDKLGESLTITETPENSGTGGHLTSEGDESLESSPEPPVCSPPHYLTANNGEQYWYERSAESMAYSANLAFPDTASLSSFCPTPVDGGSSPIRREHKCGIFSIDVKQSKSLRLFFSDKDNTCGQLVIASRESQYKIFHFHHGGLDKLAAVFEDWNFLVKPRDEETAVVDTSLKQFLVCKPEVSESELHPEEGQHKCLDADAWVTYFNEDGQIEDDLALRQAIFFGGVEPQLRANVWPFLLHYYDFRTTFLERQAIMEEKHQLYHKINAMREGMYGEELDWFRRNVQCTVEKDVVRTDRSNPCFAGNDNPNLEKMKKILLNFAVHNPVMGYTQGMSDILAPILAEVRNEADVFWCFTGLMSKTIFVTSPKDEDMEKNLSYLRELLRLMTPRFFTHMANQQDGMDLLFCHRWILLCFKREFPEDEALAMWEACWSNYQTDYFHLFLSVAIVSIYGADVVDQNLRPDETLLYFTSLAGHMQGQMVLKKARGLLHQYRSMSHLPCTLVGLCELCGPGMWDSGHVPVVACVGHPDDQPCPLTQSSTSSTQPPTAS
ncbi:TBC1 domain family member 16-like isoform X2 [Eriocheir sinensis]|uniref:TBC1 domain family member 16-like isoform X2 n=1 Tax=Eriocheir sinensis TaxID=95602 RepID=UPI0021C7B9DC|nr:TBC1 domain family member 16-like isoform X2 [Eriocheir sinensis]